MAWSKVEKAAVSWWLGLRPTAYDTAQHLENPTVNTRNALEKNLAESVAKLVQK